jgi:hypothetical protein
MSKKLHHTKQNCIDLATRMVGCWEQEDIEAYAIEKLTEYYLDNQDGFQNDQVELSNVLDAGEFDSLLVEPVEVASSVPNLEWN